MKPTRHDPAKGIAVHMRAAMDALEGLDAQAFAAELDRRQGKSPNLGNLKSANFTVLNPPLHPNDLNILRALAPSRWPRTVAQLRTTTDPVLSERTIGPRLKILELAGLVRRPFGKKGGAQITPSGKAIASE